MLDWDCRATVFSSWCWVWQPWGLVHHPDLSRPLSLATIHPDMVISAFQPAQPMLGAIGTWALGHLLGPWSASLLSTPLPLAVPLMLWPNQCTHQLSTLTWPSASSITSIQAQLPTLCRCVSALCLITSSLALFATTLLGLCPNLSHLISLFVPTDIHHLLSTLSRVHHIDSLVLCIRNHHSLDMTSSMSITIFLSHCLMTICCSWPSS